MRAAKTSQGSGIGIMASSADEVPSRTGIPENPKQFRFFQPAQSEDLALTVGVRHRLLDRQKIFQVSGMRHCHPNPPQLEKWLSQAGRMR